jgi:branched-chain amino acid transport system ATP-binding protein
MLLADQNILFCRKVANRAYVMEKGMIVADGPMEAIWQNQEIVNRYLAV